jgi:transposase
MRDTDLLQTALGLPAPWAVSGSRFDAAARRLDIDITFAKGARFACPDCGATDCPVHDTEAKSWRHLNVFQHEAYLNARVPRIRCQACGVRLVSVPWARAGSGFTLLFEAMVMPMLRATPVAEVARQVGEHDTRLWRVIHHYVDAARARDDHSRVIRAAFDETAARRGHDYVTLFVDLDAAPRVLFVADGKDADTVRAFADDLIAHGGDPARIQDACMDMSPAFIAGTAAHLPEAEITFDRFHIVKILNEAVDAVRREEQKSRPKLKRSRYLWLKNDTSLSDSQREKRDSLARSHLKTARAWQIRLTFQAFYQQPSRETAEAFLKRWYFWATHSRLSPVIEAAQTIKRHWNGILRWHETKVANGILEGINSLVQAAKAKARGYRSSRNLKAMIYLIAGRLELALPT